MVDVTPNLRAYRIKNGISLIEAAYRLGVRPVYLRYLENGEWRKLPAPCYVKFYALKYLAILGVEESKREAFAAALAKECEAAQGRPTPSSAENKFTGYFSAKLRPLGRALGALLIVGYLGWQAFGYWNAPRLAVAEPTPDAVSLAATVTVHGRAQAAATVFINDTPVPTDENGHFSVDIALQNGENTLRIVARDAGSRERVIVRKIVYEPFGVVK